MPGNRVLSRQHLSQTWQKSYDVENVWFDLNDLFADHIEEVMEKWNGIDDQIWGKVIVMEKNCRVAKMFLSKSEMVVSNDHCGFDNSGRIGLKGFENKMRDSQTSTVLRTLGKGCSIWMDLGGNIWIKNLSRSLTCSVQDDFSAGASSELKGARKLFDVNRFKSDIRKLRKTGEMRDLTKKTISIVQFGEQAEDILDQPLWLMVINIVALDFMKSKLGLDLTAAGSTEERKAEEEEESPAGHPISWHGRHPLDIVNS